MSSLAETVDQAQTWDKIKSRAVQYGLCQKCAAQIAWGHQAGFATIDRTPCAACTPLIATLPRQTAHKAWKTVTGTAHHAGPWGQAGRETGQQPTLVS